jgi:hypothetical protein
MAQRWDRMFANQLSVDEFKALAADTRTYFAEAPPKLKISNDQLMAIIMAQDFQDLTGQVIKKVVEVVQGMETQLLSVLIEAMPHTDVWPALYTRFELGLLSSLGYGLDLTRCAVTGKTEGLAWVSPRTGRAATAEAGAPHADLLLRLPPFLVDTDAELKSGDVADAFALSGYFLERRLFDHRGEGMPDQRRRLIERLGFAGRL